MPESTPEVSAEAERYVSPSHFVDSDSMEVQAFVVRALRHMAPQATQKDKAVCLFEAVRDGIRYDPFSFSLNGEDYKASVIADMDSAFCVPKAILLAACLRAVGIPAALGFADVRNHLNTPKLTELMGTDLFIYHGYVQLWLGEESFKVTPAFNMELCQRFGVKPLEFDGEHDALFHEFDDANRRHMEYVNDRGLFVDAPMQEFLDAFAVTYPKMEEFNRRRMAGETVNPDFTGPEEASEK
ncbi:MAG: transglutaminase family protein [Roseovarius sp.]|nr:transglutaminase family protein [Roseovarius sp.]